MVILRFDPTSDSGYPDEVAAESWPELEGQGFSHVTNIGWPFSGDKNVITRISDAQLVENMVEQKGAANVLVGHMMHEGVPSLAATSQHKMVGIYVRETL